MNFDSIPAEMTLIATFHIHINVSECYDSNQCNDFNYLVDQCETSKQW